MNVRSEMLAYAKRLGFKHKILSNNHIRFYGYGYSRTVSSSTGDNRVLNKVKKDLKLIVDGKPNRFCKLANSNEMS